MLNIKYDSNYKNVVNKIIEEINEKLKTYIIFDGDIENKDNISVEHPPHKKSDNKQPYHLLNYQDMKKLIEIQNKNNMPKYSIKVEKPDQYLYIQLCIDKKIMDEYNKFNNYENTFAMNMFNHNGLYIEKMNDINNIYLLVGIKIDRIEENIDPEKLNLSKLNIEYKSKYKNIANKIIENINQKLEKYNIYNKNKLEENILGKLQISEDHPFDTESNKIFDLFNYEHIIERLNHVNESMTNFEENNKFLYAMLCLQQEVINEFNTLNKIEKEKIQKLLLSRGIYFERIKEGSYTIIGINIDLIE